ncbi:MULTISPECIES: DUF2381 family protein [unclassified Corallococcus]|uniref:DUF2381 family protein n=1 Tax=unclassified Corallococcus TaxID=2685029 RepID=UPI001A90C6B3|nr:MULTISPECIES: DUF2381 family protein [unclassified Corallococcus]MBN9686544.1 DUF2381 family protein [Corallococcus sp. NCSPR001]WAS82030.1 DUF2381 family protein [Corallococcus sp. NCRR]
MRALPLLRYGLLLVLMASPSLAREVADKLTIRTLKVPAHPAQEAPSIYVSWQVVTALRFEAEVDPARTRFLGWEGRFEAPLIGGKKVILEPLRELDGGDALPLLVTLVDGTEFTFLVRARSQDNWGWIDYQVNVFKDPDSYNAVLSSLYDSLGRERRLSEENERFKKEENSVDHAYATLLANGQVKKTPFRRAKFWRSKNEDMDMVVEVFSGPEKAAAVIHLTNTYHGQTWMFDGAYLTRDFSSDTARPFALRMNRSVLVSGQSGRIAVVVDKSAFEDKEGQLADLGLQIFRDDGLLQVFVAMDHTLLRQ